MFGLLKLLFVEFTLDLLTRIVCQVRGFVAGFFEILKVSVVQLGVYFFSKRCLYLEMRT